MTKVFTAKTIDEAKAIAEAEFGVSQDKIQFVVLEEPKKSLFGKVKCEAKIEATVEESKPMAAANYIKEVFSKMGYEVSVDIKEANNGAVLDISGDNVDEIIGKKGEVLDSLQYLSSLVCNRIDREYYRISIDCNGFRERRNAQLERLAKKIANNVKRNGRTTALEPMNPYERRIIHSVISDIDGVTSFSKGEEPYRKVIVSSTEKKRYDNRGRRNNRSYNGAKKGYDIVSSFEKEYKKPKPEDEMGSSGLYTKIDL